MRTAQLPMDSMKEKQFMAPISMSHGRSILSALSAHLTSTGPVTENDYAH